MKNLEEKRDNFISKSKLIHNNKYDYSLVEYVNYNTKVKIICPFHGVFEQTPNDHLRGRGVFCVEGKTLLVREDQQRKNL